MRKLGLFLGAMMLASGPLWAASGIVSLSSHAFSIKNGKVDESITVLQDSSDANQWYYAPPSIRLSETTNKKDPLFMLVSYQGEGSSEDAGVEQNIGVLQAAFNFGLTTDGLKNLKDALVKEEKNNNIRLAPLPISNVEVNVYNIGGESLGCEIQKPTFGGNFAGNVPVQMNLDNITTALVDGLAKGTGGLQAMVAYDYRVLLPTCNIKVTADWEQMHKHFSTDTQACATYSGWFYSAEAKTDFQTVREYLDKHCNLKIEISSDEKLSEETINKYLEPVINQINKEFFDIKPPEKVPAAEAKDITGGRGRRISGGISFALKSEQERKRGTYSYDMTKNLIVTRRTSTSGMFGLNGYSQEQRNKAVVTIDPTYWKSAYFSLPTAGSGPVESIDYSVSIMYKDNPKAKPVLAEGTKKATAKWTANNDFWTVTLGDDKGNEVLNLAFPLKSTFDYYKDKKSVETSDLLKKLIFKTEMTITVSLGKNNKDSKTFVEEFPFELGNNALTTPMTKAYFLEFIPNDREELAWSKQLYTKAGFRNYESDLTDVTIKVKPDNGKQTTTKLTKTSQPTIFWLDRKKVTTQVGEGISITEYVVPEIDVEYTFKSNKVANALNKSGSVVIKDKLNQQIDPILICDEMYLPVNPPSDWAVSSLAKKDDTK